MDIFLRRIWLDVFCYRKNQAVDQVRQQIKVFGCDLLLAIFPCGTDRNLAAANVDREIHRMREGRPFLYMAVGNELEITALRKDCGLIVDRAVLKATGKKGVPQGGVISPLLSNLYLNEVDRMLEKAVGATRRGKSTNVQYARFADDMVILIDPERRSAWLVKAIDRRRREEFAKLRVAINEDKSRLVDLKEGKSFTFLGFEYRRVLSLQRKWRTTFGSAIRASVLEWSNAG